MNSTLFLTKGYYCYYRMADNYLYEISESMMVNTQGENLRK